MTKRKNIFTFSFCLLTAIASLNMKIQNESLSIIGFDQKAWKLDSIGCDKNRTDLAKLLVANKKQLFNRKRKEVVP